MYRLLLIFSFLFFLSFGLVSCRSSEDKPNSSSNEQSAFTDTQPFEGDWLIYHINAEPATLNPITATDVYESVINYGNIYETLVKRDNATLNIVPLLAEFWDISDDKLTYTFHIRKGIKWQDGVPFTSSDVVFSFQLRNTNSLRLSITWHKSTQALSSLNRSDGATP